MIDDEVFVVITTHGTIPLIDIEEKKDYTYDKYIVEQFPSQLNLQILNAVNLGVCNYMHPKYENKIFTEIFYLLTLLRRDKINIDNILSIMKNQFFQNNNLYLNIKKEFYYNLINNSEKERAHTFLNTRIRHNIINQYKINDLIINKQFIIYNNETPNNEPDKWGQWSNKIILINKNGNILNIMPELNKIEINNNLQKTNMIYLCEYLKNKNYNKAHLIDLSCSIFYDEYKDEMIGNSNSRLLRAMLRDIKTDI